MYTGYLDDIISPWIWSELFYPLADNLVGVVVWSWAFIYWILIFLFIWISFSIFNLWTDNISWKNDPDYRLRNSVNKLKTSVDSLTETISGEKM